MQPTTRKVLYAVLALLMILDFYSIFNAGNPNSLFRFIVRDPSWDLTITIAISLIIAVISLLMFQGTNTNSIRNLIDKNRDYVVQLKHDGLSAEEIADSFIGELHLKRAVARRLIRPRVIREIRKIVK